MNSPDALFPLIDGFILDLESLSAIEHSCASGNCNMSQCCCGRYEIIIDEAELSNIIDMIPQASRYAPGLRSDKGFDNVFDYEGRNTYSIDKNDEGFCVFGYKTKGGKVFCSLHTAAIDTKVPINSVKPLSCILWPLALVETNPPILSVQEEVSEFPCNREKISSTLSLDSGIADNIKMAFGDAFLKKIQAELLNLRRRSDEKTENHR